MTSRDEGTNVTAARVHRDECTLRGLGHMAVRIDRLASDRRRLTSDGAIRGALQREIQRGMNRDISVFPHIREHGIDYSAHGVARCRLVDSRRAPLVLRDPERLTLGAAGAVGGDESLICHEAEDEVAPAEGGPWVPSRRVGRWCLGESGEHRPLGDRQLVDMLAEEIAARGLDSIHAIAEIDDVQVMLEYLILGELALHES